MEPVRESETKFTFVFVAFSVISWQVVCDEPVVLSLLIPFFLSAKLRRALFGSSTSA